MSAKPTPKYKYGFLLTTYNDSDQAVEAYKSLLTSIPPGDSYKFVVVDGGSNDEHRKVIEGNIGSIAYTHRDLSSALNGGIYTLLGYQPDGSNMQEFINNGYADVDYVFWIHVDMRFNDFDWANKLCFCYEYCWPTFGKLAPGTRNIDGSHPGIPLRGGNTCPWCMGSTFLREFYTEYKRFFDPQFAKIGGAEDYSMNADIIKMGYGFGICSLVDVWHKGMGSRELQDTVADQIHNREVYEKIHGKWEEPGFEVDVSELGRELRKAFEDTFEDRWYNK